MPRQTRRNDSPLYRRGPYQLRWDRRRDGALRSPYLAIFWYDPAKRGTRSASTGETELGPAITALDRFYVERTEGLPYCPHCGQLRQPRAGYSVIDAIETYCVMVATRRSSEKAIKARLAHVLDYLDTLPDPSVPCEAVDEAWVASFRAWLHTQPIASSRGKTRRRTLSTVENSVGALSAAINDAYERKNTVGKVRFKVIPLAQVNRSPRHRSDVAELAAMFRYCVAPAGPTCRSPEELARRVRERAGLHRFLIASIATLARPDAVHDISTRPERRQWNSNARILSLNPDGRPQTKKYRPVVPVPWQFALHLDQASGFYVGCKSVKGAWESMAAELELPGDGEGGTKLIRRSVAKILRDRLPKADWPELEMYLGHRMLAATSDIYAPFDPGYLGSARAALEALIDEIEALVPGAFSRKIAGDGAEVVLIGRAKK